MTDRPPRCLELYPALTAVQPALGELGAAARPIEAPVGTVMFDEAAPCRGFPMLLEGEVKVARRSGDGRELELYRVLPGELCLVSCACLFRATPMTAFGVVTRAVSLLLISPEVFLQWLETPRFRNEVLGLFAERLADLTALVDAVAFRRLDARLAGALLGHGPEIATTHQALADELGTVREIVSRLLQRFEREGYVALARERIRILDSAALRALSGAE